MAAHKRTAHKCQICGAEFIGGAGSLFCPECKIQRQKDYIRDYQRERAAIKKELKPNTYTCEDCGAVLPIQNNHKPKRCPTCAKERARENRRNWQAGHRSKRPQPQPQAKRRIMRGKKPALSFEDIRAMQSRREAETGRRPTYGQIAAEPYLAQQAAEMEARRRQREGG